MSISKKFIFSGYRDIPAVHVLLLHGVLRGVGERGRYRLPDLPSLGRSSAQSKLYIFVTVFLV